MALSTFGQGWIPRTPRIRCSNLGVGRMGFFFFFFKEFYLLFFLRFIYLLYVSTLYLHCSCLQTHQKRASDFVTDGCEPPCGCWDLNSGPWEEQLVLLTTEPPHQPESCLFKNVNFVNFLYSESQCKRWTFKNTPLCLCVCPCG